MKSTAIRILDADLFFKADCLLGEGPFWHDGRLYWLDILNSRMYSCDGAGKNPRVATFPSHIGTAAPWKDGFIAGTRQGIGILARDESFSLLPETPQLAEG